MINKKRKHYVSVPLKIIKTRHLLLEASLNSVSGLFILDTGASNTCLDIEMSTYFGLDFKDNSIAASGAGGNNIPTKISKKNTLKIGTWHLAGLKIIGINFDSINGILEQCNCSKVHGIIGSDVIKRGKGIINYPRKLLYLK